MALAEGGYELDMMPMRPAERCSRLRLSLLKTCCWIGSMMVDGGGIDW